MSVAQMLMGQIENAGLLFNVHEDSIYLQNGTVIDDKKAIVNSNTGQPMAVVGSGYKVVPNLEVFDGFTKSVEASGLNADGATIDVKHTPNMARTMVNFVFPNEFVEINGDTSKTALQISALNSYDGTTRYVTKAGGLRMKCLNGQILGNIVGAYSGTHSKNLDVEAGAQRVIQMIQEFQNAKEYWGSLMTTKITADQAVMVLQQLLNIRCADDDEKLAKHAQYQNALTVWNSYKRDFGSTAYALYNTCTELVTHKKSRNPNSDLVSLMTRQKRLSHIMDNHSIFKTT